MRRYPGYRVSPHSFLLSREDGILLCQVNDLNPSAGKVVPLRKSMSYWSSSTPLDVISAITCRVVGTLNPSCLKTVTE